MKLPGIFVKLLGIWFLCGAAVAAAQEGKSVWRGVYTDAQAADGRDVYSVHCSRCHKDDLTGSGGTLIGSHFMSEWSEDSLGSFYKILRQTMPANAPGSLSERDYLAIIAYVLQKNEFPAGAQPLTVNEVSSIRIESKNGPGPVPDFSLVETVGCLGQKPDGSWMVTGATEPIRTRDPKDSPADELPGLKARPAGSHTFSLLDFGGVQDHPMKDQKVEVKGFLIRRPGDDRINPSSVLMLGPCGPQH